MGPRKRLLGAIASADTPADAPRQSAEQSAVPVPKAPKRGEAERRQLTVMFCDLVGSVELGERLDVEEYRDLLGRFRRVVVAAVEHFDGFVASHQGDGLLVYFGYPQAREDDAERAVRAGLDVVQSIVGLEHPHDADVKVRIGIATGLAVVGDLLSTGTTGHTELAALGPTPNLAARLQGEASENSVLISDITRRLVSGHFTLETLPPRHLKGMSGKTALYQVKSARSGQTRFAARTDSRLSPFTGREEEIELLKRRWQQVGNGRGQAVIVVGEPGIGKSRLLEQFRSVIPPRPHELLLLQCSPYLANSALHPVVQVLGEALDFATIRDARGRLARLEDWLVGTDPALANSAGLLADLLSIPTEGRYLEAAALDAQKRRENLLAWPVRYLQAQSRHGPVMCIFEDLHWADPSTRVLLGHLVEAIEEMGVLVVGTARPGFEAPWSDFAHVHLMTLSRLGRGESERLAASIVEARAPRVPAFFEDIANRAGGNPLFIEELTRAVMHSRSHNGEERAVPATLQDSLMARLDALGSGKQVAQWGSVIGREFGEDVLREAWDGEAEVLLQGLDELHRSGLIYLRADGPHGTYRFKHALVRDAAYNSMLKSLRQTLHDKVLSALEKLRPETPREILAHHASEGHRVAKALDYWEQAGRNAAARSANQEAIEHYRRGIALIDEADVESPAAELALQSALGPLLMVDEGDASKAAEAAFEKSLVLADRLNSPPDVQFPLAWGLWYLHLQRGNRAQVDQLANLMGRMSSESGRSAHLLETHHSEWTFNMHYGQLANVSTSTDAGLAMYDAEEHAELRFQFANHDPKMCAHFHAAMAESLRGRMQHADHAIRDSLQWAQTLEHLPTLAIARLVPLLVSFWKDDGTGIQDSAPAFLEACDDVGAGWYRAVGVIFDAWAEAHAAPGAGAHRRILEAIDIVRTTGQVTRMPMYLTALAEALQAEGHCEDALIAAQQAIRSCKETGQTTYEPHALHTIGVVQQSLSAGSNPNDAAEAAASFTAALKLAQAMGAPLFALRPAIALAELYRSSGRGEEAHALLAPIHGQFGDKPDFPLLSRAGKVLAALQ
jgi:predicted ATPase/class 3 adenylate cyclase